MYMTGIDLVDGLEDNRNNKIGELLGEKVCASNDVPTIKAEVNRYRELTLLGLIR